METSEVIRASHNEPKTQLVSKWAVIDRGLPGQGDTAVWPLRGRDEPPRRSARGGFATRLQSTQLVLSCCVILQMRFLLVLFLL